MASPFGRLSTRKFLSVVAAMVVTTFASILLASPTAHAADATWTGAAITYNNNQYVAMPDAKAGDGTNLPPGSKLYGYIEQLAAGSSGPQKAHVISFAPGTDPAKATSADYALYDFVPPGQFSNRSSVTTITLAPSATPGSTTGTTSCDGRFTFGLGWIICPASNLLSGAVDWLFNVLSSFLVVRPLGATQNTALYRAWSIMRNFANVAFVIAFLIIIYSQLTSLGLSNYGIKRMMPRLIIAAILVNVSYWICALAIDISNILGISLQQLLIGVRNSLVGDQGNSWHISSFSSVTSFILSGGTAAVAGGIALYAFAAGAGGALFLLLPMLVGAVLAVLVALLVMAARQAIITLLVIIAPLAFVAYLLPNTEKYFDKWKDLFLTMLLMFPGFSMVFGGAQLAGAAIIQNADSINTVLLGMAVQVAPVAITPLLLKLSGSLLGRIAGIINNPNRGMIDRTRKWSQERADEHKARAIANAGNRRRDFLARRARNIDHRRRRRAEWRKVNEAVGDNLFHASDGYQAIDTASREADRTKKLIENQHEAHWNTHVRLDPHSLERELRLRVAVDEVNAAKARLDTIHEEFKTNNLPATSTPGMHTLLTHSKDVEKDLAMTALRKQAAERLGKSQLTKALLENVETVDGQTLREYAGGVQGAEGAATVLASTVAASRKEYNDKVSEKVQLIRHFNLDSEKRQELALGNNVQATRDGVTYTFRNNDVYSREAAIETQLKEGSYTQMRDIIAESGERVVDRVTGVVRQGHTFDFRTTISTAIPSNGLNKKAVFWGAKTIDDVAQGKINGEAGLNEAAAYFLTSGKISDEALSGMSADAIRQLFEVADQTRPTTTQTRNPADLRAFTENAASIRESARRILDSDLLRRNADEAARKVLEDYAA